MSYIFFVWTIIMPIFGALLYLFEVIEPINYKQKFFLSIIFGPIWLAFVIYQYLGEEK